MNTLWCARLSPRGCLGSAENWVLVGIISLRRAPCVPIFLHCAESARTPSSTPVGTGAPRIHTGWGGAPSVRPSVHRVCVCVCVCLCPSVRRVCVRVSVCPCLYSVTRMHSLTPFPSKSKNALEFGCESSYSATNPNVRLKVACAPIPLQDDPWQKRFGCSIPGLTLGLPPAT